MAVRASSVRFLKKMAWPVDRGTGLGVWLVTTNERK